MRPLTLSIQDLDSEELGGEVTWVPPPVLTENIAAELRSTRNGRGTGPGELLGVQWVPKKRGRMSCEWMVYDVFFVVFYDG